MKKLFCMLVVLLACPLAAMPAAAQQCGIPADANSDGNLTQEELASAIVSYMLGGGDLKLEDLRDAAFIYAYWTPETAGNFTLTVFGNANGDDTIDVRDLIYIREVISGKKPWTKLADANYDGEINRLDVAQTKLIILGREKEITVLDSVNRTVTVKEPVERIVVTDDNQAELIRLLGAERKVVGIEGSVPERGYFPVMSDKPQVGNQWSGLNYELILELNPDVVIALASPAPIEPVEKLGEVGITAVCVDTIDFDKRANVIMLLGYVLGEKERAREYVEWREEKLGIIRERLKDVAEEDKPKTLFKDTDFRGVFGKDYVMSNTLEMAGMKNICPGRRMEFDPEWVIANNPDIILLGDWESEYVGYKINDSAKASEDVKKETEVPGFENITAVRNGDVYEVEYMLLGTRGDIGVLYLAKVAYPEKFKDVDPVKIHREYFENWLRVDYQGTFFYPHTWE